MRARLARHLALLVSALLLIGAGRPEPIPEAPELLRWVRSLADPALEGRASGSPGAERAARRIAEEFRRLGLRPGGDGGSHLQAFEVMKGIRVVGGNALEATIDGAARPFTAGPDFLPHAFSESGEADGELVFAGYGITAPELGYDDYAGLDVRGKIVLVMTHEPRERDPEGPFRRAEAFPYTELRHKAINAREHGALGIIVVPNPHHADEPPRLPRGTSAAWGILAVKATRAVAEALLAPTGRSLARLQAEIDRGPAPRSVVIPGARVRLRVALLRERGETANVVGVLPGTDPRLAHEAVVVGAHYDHLGRGSQFSLAPEQADEIHPGADDNASGTAAVIGLARAFAATGGARRSLVFVAFSGEELGLLGSTHYVKHPPIPLADTVAMVNLDSVGRMQGRRLFVLGVGSGTGLRALVEEAARGLDVELALREDAFGPSDHTPFYSRGRPILFFFTGTHADYHRPTDTWEKVNAEGLRSVVAVAFRTLRALADRPERPAFVRLPDPPGPRGGGGGYGAYFGSVPDFSESDAPGVRLADVRPGGPAERAGLRSGDIVVRLGGVTVRTLDDLVFVLRSRRAGDAVEVVYLRDGVEHRAQAVLQTRR